MQKDYVFIQCKQCGEMFDVPRWASKGHTVRCSKCRVRHGKTKTRLYNIWENMKQRCDNPKKTSYEIYGGKGITYCEEWKKFLNFEQWAIENGYSDELSIDRIDSDKNYEPSNCRWATKTVQSRNSSISKNNSLGVKGVYERKDGRSKKYCARITIDYTVVNLGDFYNLEDARLAYNNYVIANNLEHKLA